MIEAGDCNFTDVGSIIPSGHIDGASTVKVVLRIRRTATEIQDCARVHSDGGWLVSLIGDSGIDGRGFAGSHADRRIVRAIVELQLDARASRKRVTTVGESDSATDLNRSRKRHRIAAIRARTERGGIHTGIVPVLIVRADCFVAPVAGIVGPVAAAVLRTSHS